jgi:hypothetical protein
MNIQHKGVITRDSKEAIRIRVKPEDLKKAVCRDRQRCAIAISIMRQTHADWVDVGVETVLVKRGKHATRFSLDAIAKDQVRYFDEHRRFAPCSVILRPPSISKRLGARKGMKSSGPSGLHLKRRKPTR